MKTYQLPVSIDEYIDKYCSDALETIPGTKETIIAIRVHYIAQNY
jgi:hypothetical protein